MGCVSSSYNCGECGAAILLAGGRGGNGGVGGGAAGGAGALVNAA